MKELTIKMIEEAINEQAEVNVNFGAVGMVKLALAQGYITEEQADYYYGCIREGKPVEKEETKPVEFVVGAEYKLHCQNGDLAKRTVKCVLISNNVGLFKIGNTYQEMIIRLSKDGKTYWAIHPFNACKGVFKKYENWNSKDIIK